MTGNLPLNIKLAWSLFCTALQWGAVQNTPCQGGNETFQGPLTSPPEILEDHCGVIQYRCLFNSGAGGKIYPAQWSSNSHWLTRVQLNDPLTVSCGVTLESKE